MPHFEGKENIRLITKCEASHASTEREFGRDTQSSVFSGWRGLSLPGQGRLCKLSVRPLLSGKRERQQRCGSLHTAVRRELISTRAQLGTHAGRRITFAGKPRAWHEGSVSPS